MLLLGHTSGAGTALAQRTEPTYTLALRDVSLGEALVQLVDFAFRTASGFIELPAGTELTIDITAPDAEDNSSPVFTRSRP